MKRSGFQIKTRKPLRRTKLHVVGKSTTSELKQDIQALLRQIAIKRDKKCILHGVRCHNEVGMEGVVWQADHLESRSHSATFADERLVVLICRPCHYWKSVGSNLRKAQYDAMVKKILPKERVELWEKCEADNWKPKRKDSLDWMLAKVALKQKLSEMDD